MKLHRTNDPKTTQVASWQYIETTLVDPNRKLHIMSGIAIPSFECNDDDKIYRETCELYTGVTLPDFIQATCEVGLASVGNGESSFVFALDESWVAPDPNAGGELVLYAKLAVNGENSGLNRFGFQIVALAGNRITGVSGHIRWHRSVFDASQFTDGARLVAATSNQSQTITPDSGFAFEKLTPLGGDGAIGGISRVGDEFAVPYSFDHLPLNIPLRLTWRLAANFPQDCVVGQISGPNPVFLTPTHLAESGVDFRVSRNQVR